MLEETLGYAWVNVPVLNMEVDSQPEDTGRRISQMLSP